MQISECTMSRHWSNVSNIDHVSTDSKTVFGALSRSKSRLFFSALKVEVALSGFPLREEFHEQLDERLIYVDSFPALLYVLFWAAIHFSLNCVSISQILSLSYFICFIQHTMYHIEQSKSVTHFSAVLKNDDFSLEANMFDPRSLNCRKRLFQGSCFFDNCFYKLSWWH